MIDDVSSSVNRVVGTTVGGRGGSVVVMVVVVVVVVELVEVTTSVVAKGELFVNEMSKNVRKIAFTNTLMKPIIYKFKNPLSIYIARLTDDTLFS